MVRPYLPESELERAEVWLDAIEAGDTSTAEIARDTGLTQRRIRQRVKDARERRERGDQIERRNRDLDRFDYPYMELSHSPSGGHPFCVPSGDLCSEDRGKFHVGGRVRSLLGGQPLDQAEGGGSDSSSGRTTPEERAETGAVWVQR